jgi:hypothetical protein
MQSHLFTMCGHLYVCSNCASLIMETTKMCPICCTPDSQVRVSACVCVCVCVCVFVFLPVCLSVCLGLFFFVSLSVSVMRLCESIG